MARIWFTSPPLLQQSSSDFNSCSLKEIPQHTTLWQRGNKSCLSPSHLSAPPPSHFWQNNKSIKYIRSFFNTLPSLCLRPAAYINLQLCCVTGQGGRGWLRSRAGQAEAVLDSMAACRGGELPHWLPGPPRDSPCSPPPLLQDHKYYMALTYSKYSPGVSILPHWVASQMAPYSVLLTRAHRARSLWKWSGERVYKHLFLVWTTIINVM